MFKDLKPTAVLFDLYKTLLDIWTDEDHPDVWDKLARFLRYRGMSADAGQLHHSYFFLAQRCVARSREMYPEIDTLAIFRMMLLDLGYDGPDDLSVEVAHLFRALSVRHFELFPDTLPTLRMLRNFFRLGLISDAQRVFLEPEIQMNELESLLDIVIVSSDYAFHKPDPRMFTMALDQLEIKPEQAIYVGDSISRDILGAQAVGIKAILINRNNYPLDFNDYCKPDKVIRSLDELRHWLVV